MVKLISQVENWCTHIVCGGLDSPRSCRVGLLMNSLPKLAVCSVMKSIIFGVMLELQIFHPAVYDINFVQLLRHILHANSQNQVVSCMRIYV